MGGLILRVDLRGGSCSRIRGFCSCVRDFDLKVKAGGHGVGISILACAFDPEGCYLHEIGKKVIEGFAGGEATGKVWNDGAVGGLAGLAAINLDVVFHFVSPLSPVCLRILCMVPVGISVLCMGTGTWTPGLFGWRIMWWEPLMR